MGGREHTQLKAIILLIVFIGWSFSLAGSPNVQDYELSKSVRVVEPSQSTNMALYFDGSDEVLVPTAASLNPTDAITIMAWIKADDWVGNRRILQKGTDDQYQLIDEGGLQFGLAGVVDGGISTPLPSTRAWHHVAGSYDGAYMKIYVDGLEMGSESASGSIATSSKDLAIGNKPGSVGSLDRFKGVIDEVRVYNRSLSNQEIYDTMDNSSTSESGLILYFSFDTLDGSTCLDLSGNGNNGTNYGAGHVTSFSWTTNDTADAIDSWTFSNYKIATESLFGTFNYFNLSKYGGGWQYEVTRDWTDIAFTNGKYIWHDAQCIVGLVSAYQIFNNVTYLNYAEDIWAGDQNHFWDETYGGYYVRLNQDNSPAISDKGMFEHGWYGLATILLYEATGNTTYRDQSSTILEFILDNFYDPSDGSYYGALKRSLGVSVSDIDTNWCAPYARFLTQSYRILPDANTFKTKAIELVDNIIAHAYDPVYGWIVNRVSSDWSTFTKTSKGWYDVLQTFIDAYII
ncbi:MAG: AGE family epimerase/isomerase [Candidatus Thorarchaeota archaeon]|nr:AGE family epimerase/isomerase [Candidatus Thorarchaeota archaeon]